MSRVEKTVFISYRRTNVYSALSVFQNLTQHGYDVFFDLKGIASGDFESVILGNIEARAHFLVLLTPSALERCGDTADWLRREIETALALKRNIVPLMLEGFDFSTPGIADQLKGTLAALKNYNALPVPAEYFEEAMGRLRDNFLSLPLDAVLHPPTLPAQQAAKEQQAAAANAPVVQKGLLTEQEAKEWSERLEKETRLVLEGIYRTKVENPVRLWERKLDTIRQYLEDQFPRHEVKHQSGNEVRATLPSRRRYAHDLDYIDFLDFTLYLETAFLPSYRVRVSNEFLQSHSPKEIAELLRLWNLAGELRSAERSSVLVTRDGIRPDTTGWRIL